MSDDDEVPTAQVPVYAREITYDEFIDLIHRAAHCVLAPVVAEVFRPVFEQWVEDNKSTATTLFDAAACVRDIVREELAPMEERLMSEFVSVRMLLSRIDKRTAEDLPILIIEEMKRMNEGVLRIIRQNEGRRAAPSEETKRVLIAVVKQYYGGRCASCRETIILDDAGARIPGLSEFDHHHGRQHARVTNMWLPCRTCHADFTYGRRDRATDPTFGLFQQCVARYLDSTGQRYLDIA